MGSSSRDRIRLNRKRFNIRKAITIKNFIILGSIALVIFITFSIITANALKHKVKNSTIVYEAKEDNNLHEEKKDQANSLDEENSVTASNNQDNNFLQSINNQDDRITLNILGELMMGGEVSNRLNFSYAQAIKDVYSTTRTSNFTYCNFSTNITNLDNAKNVKSKYIVTKDITSALDALGLDAVSIASDHITDYSSDILKNTISILEENNIFVAGRENTPVYFEKDGKKIAIVSTNSVIIGTAKNYFKEGISVYSKDNLKKNISEAKESADVVIADIHWGRDHTYGITNQMREIAKSAIDSGADMVIGSHALGVYPIVKYNNKPIIYSTGYLMTDLDYTVAKEGFIFKLNISGNGKIDTLEMIPTYIEDKEAVRLYSEYDKEKCKEYLEQFNNWHLENSLDSKVEDEKIVISF